MFTNNWLAHLFTYPLFEWSDYLFINPFCYTATQYIYMKLIHHTNWMFNVNLLQIDQPLLMTIININLLCPAPKSAPESARLFINPFPFYLYITFILFSIFNWFIIIIFILMYLLHFVFLFPYNISLWHSKTITKTMFPCRCKLSPTIDVFFSTAIMALSKSMIFKEPGPPSSKSQG